MYFFVAPSVYRTIQSLWNSTIATRCSKLRELGFPFFFLVTGPGDFFFLFSNTMTCIFLSLFLFLYSTCQTGGGFPTCVLSVIAEYILAIIIPLSPWERRPRTPRGSLKPWEVLNPVCTMFFLPMHTHDKVSFINRAPSEINNSN